MTGVEKMFDILGITVTFCIAELAVFYWIWRGLHGLCWHGDCSFISCREKRTSLFLFPDNCSPWSWRKAKVRKARFFMAPKIQGLFILGQKEMIRIEKTMEERILELEKKVEGLTALLGDLGKRFLDHVARETESSGRYARLVENVTEQGRLLSRHLMEHLGEKIEMPLKDQPVS